MKKHTISIITPTYKGGAKLIEVYAAIKNQTFQPKEWIIVLDGIDDATLAIAKNISESAAIDIVIEVIEHNHKKAAVNRGLQIATGDFSLIADDDDLFPVDAIETLMNAWATIADDQKHKYVGVTGLCQDERGQIIGDKFPTDQFHSNSIECSLKKKIKGEKWGMQKTEILKKYPYFEGAEGYVGEGTVWMTIGKKYNTLYINKVVRTYNFTPNSIINSRHNKEKIIKNCQAYTYGYKFTCENFFWESLSYPRYFLACSVNYTRYYLHSVRFSKYKNWMTPFSSFKALLSFSIGLPIGLFFFIRDWED